MNSENQSACTLQNFVVEHVLSQDGRSKTVVVLGRLEGKEGPAIAILARKHFQLETTSLQSTLRGTECKFQFSNDIYQKFGGSPPSGEESINIDIIHPATAKHIIKYSQQTSIMVEETPALYKAKVQPYIQQLPAKDKGWIYNILEKGAEADRVVYKDTSAETGFFLVVDQKWDQQQVEGLYLQAFVSRKDLSSVRDITEKHLGLLKNIRDQAKEAIKERYKVDPSELRLWVHYLPSFYHFHVHCAHTRWDGFGLQAGKAILLNDVIDNVENICGDYWQKRTLTYSIGKNDPLLAELY